jgi:hypothetical protein
MARLSGLIPVPIAFGVILTMALALGDVPRASANQSPSSVTVNLDEIDDSGVQGTAVLTAQGDQTLVVLDVVGAPGDHPDHIHRSTCADPEPNPLYPLTDVVLNESDEAGHSETVVDVPLAELLAEPHLILIHKSKDEISVYVACGNIVSSAVDMPNTGGGMTAVDRSSRMWMVVAGAALLVFMSGLMHAFALPVWEARRSRLR